MYRMYLKSACSCVSEHYKFDKFCDLITYIKNPTEDNWWLGSIYSIHIISDDTDNEIVLCYDKGTKRLYHYLGNKNWRLMSTNIATLKKYADKVMRGAQIMKYYVTCTDKFMSGWGMAENRISKFVVECDSYNDAYICKCNMQKESCFKYIKIHVGKIPYYNPRTYHVSVKSFAECTAYNH